MKNKIWIGSLLAVIMLVTISFSTTVSSDTVDVTKKESPLYGIRARQVLKEKLGVIMEKIKTKFLGERIFFIPFQSLLNINDLANSYFPAGKVWSEQLDCTQIMLPTCFPHAPWCFR